MPVFRHTFEVRAPLDQVLAFHCNVQNLIGIQPPLPHIRHIEAPETLKPGSRITFHFSLSPFKEWQAVIDEVRDNGRGHALMIDSSVRSPFPFWRHRHEFFSLDGRTGTLIQDCIDYDLPGGAVGWLLLPFFHLALLSMFLWRQVRTRSLL